MDLPETFEPYRTRRVWCCYPLIWDPKRHNGFGGYAKPPISPHSLEYASTDDPETLGTYDEAAARVGQYINYYGQHVELKGVGLSLTLSGLVAVDLDSVAILTPDTPGQRGRMTEEAGEVIALLDTYTELSPSGNGLHLFLSGTLPDGAPKLRKGKRDIKGGTAAEYQIMTAGYVTLSGDIIGNHDRIEDRTAPLAEFCRKYLAADPAEPDGVPAANPAPKQQPKPRPATGNNFFSWERWKAEADDLSDAELLNRIYSTPRIGGKVRALYEAGDISAYSNDHSYADLQLCCYLYGFTHDRARTESLFKASALYRKTGKSASYLSWLSKRAEAANWQFIGTIKGEPTADDRREYAQGKEREELARLRKWKENKASRTASGSEGDAGNLG